MEDDFMFFQGHNTSCSPFSFADICSAGEIIAEKMCS